MGKRKLKNGIVSKDAAKREKENWNTLRSGNRKVKIEKREKKWENIEPQGTNFSNQSTRGKRTRVKKKIPGKSKRRISAGGDGGKKMQAFFT